ncbi:hypothetical protein [Microbulbifer aggregans]|uniref:hypothetical protein n=1 Tax=Microbulbifer aggregans TaxID=1769779 RepID=UPI001CFDBE37|nr:hypothetical protein [Microbulbifer aggregans]
MNKLKVFTYILLFLGCSVHAEDIFLIPDESPIQLASVGPAHGDVATFKGDVIISGRFVIGWKFLDGEPFQLEARLYPDDQSKMLLPHEAGQSQVEELYLSPAEEAAKTILTEDQARKLLKKEIVTTSGNAIVQVGSYSTAIECDRRWYMVDIIKLVSPELLASVSGEEYGFGC